jgi:hypothetical protein
MDSLADQPQADEATELRAAPKTAALYRSGTTQGWPTRWYYQPDADYTTASNFVIDPIMVMVQTLSLPVTLLPDFPFRKVYYAGDVLPPSYTAMPPLPPEILHGPPNPDPDPLSASQAPVIPPIAPLPVERAPLIVPPAPPAPAVTRPAPKPRPAVVPPAPTTRPVR